MPICEKCEFAVKVYRDYRLAPFDVDYVCSLGKKKSDCGSHSATASKTPAAENKSSKASAVEGKRNSDMLNQEEIDALAAAASEFNHDPKGQGTTAH